MAYTYTSWSTQLLNVVAAQSTDPNWTTELPGIIDYAEQRIYRDLDLLATRVTDASATLTAGQRTFSLPTSLGTFLVVEEINVLVPSSTGSRTTLVPASKQFVDAAFPSAALVNGPPEFCAPLDNQTFLLGPAPDLNYPVEVVGTQRPQPLSFSNQTTILTTMLPDLWMTATMIKASAFMRNFGSQSDNPQMAVSYESQYTALLRTADTEEARKQYRSQGWTSEKPSMITTPSRV